MSKNEAFPQFEKAFVLHYTYTSRSPYAEQFQTLKKSFELDKDELSETEALEAVSVKLAAATGLAASEIEKL